MLKASIVGLGIILSTIAFAEPITQKVTNHRWNHFTNWVAQMEVTGKVQLEDQNKNLADLNSGIVYVSLARGFKNLLLGTRDLTIQAGNQKFNFKIPNAAFINSSEILVDQEFSTQPARLKTSVSASYYEPVTNLEENFECTWEETTTMPEYDAEGNMSLRTTSTTYYGTQKATVRRQKIVTQRSIQIISSTGSARLNLLAINSEKVDVLKVHSTCR